jgi:hypothetical protein
MKAPVTPNPLYRILSLYNGTIKPHGSVDSGSFIIDAPFMSALKTIHYADYFTRFSTQFNCAGATLKDVHFSFFSALFPKSKDPLLNHPWHCTFVFYYRATIQKIRLPLALDGSTDSDFIANTNTDQTSFNGFSKYLKTETQTIAQKLIEQLRQKLSQFLIQKKASSAQIEKEYTRLSNKISTKNNAKTPKEITTLINQCQQLLNCIRLYQYHDAKNLLQEKNNNDFFWGIYELENKLYEQLTPKKNKQNRTIELTTPPITKKHIRPSQQKPRQKTTKKDNKININTISSENISQIAMALLAFSSPQKIIKNLPESKKNILINFLTTKNGSLYFLQRFLFLFEDDEQESLLLSAVGNLHLPLSFLKTIKMSPACWLALLKKSIEDELVGNCLSLFDYFQLRKLKINNDTDIQQLSRIFIFSLNSKNEKIYTHLIAFLLNNQKKINCAAFYKACCDHFFSIERTIKGRDRPTKEYYLGTKQRISRFFNLMLFFDEYYTLYFTTSFEESKETVKWLPVLHFAAMIDHAITFYRNLSRIDKQTIDPGKISGIIKTALKFGSKKVLSLIFDHIDINKIRCLNPKNKPETLLATAMRHSNRNNMILFLVAHGLIINTETIRKVLGTFVLLKKTNHHTSAPNIFQGTESDYLLFMFALDYLVEYQALGKQFVDIYYALFSQSEEIIHSCCDNMSENKDQRNINIRIGSIVMTLPPNNYCEMLAEHLPPEKASRIASMLKKTSRPLWPTTNSFSIFAKNRLKNSIPIANEDAKSRAFIKEM